MARARDIPQLRGEVTFAEAGRAAVRVRAEEVFAFAPAVLESGDVGAVKDMRVATRRLRAVLEVFAPAFDRREHRAVLRDVKALADALGARRDPDVQLNAVAELAAASGVGAAAYARCTRALRAEQATGDATLREALERAGEAELEARLRALTRERDGVA